MTKILVAQIVTGGILLIFEDGEISYFQSEVLHQHRFDLGIQAEAMVSDQEHRIH